MLAQRVARKVECGVLEGFSLFLLITGLKAVDACFEPHVKIEKADKNKDDEFIPLPVDRKVLIEYYQHLGRGPL